MKFAETDKTVTTLDVSAGFMRNAYGGSPLAIRAVVATIERGTYSAGPPSDEVRKAHADALLQLGWTGKGHDQPITHGVKTQIDLDAAPGAWPRKLEPAQG